MMRICASLSHHDDILSEDFAKADMVEIRTDVFEGVPSSMVRRGPPGLLSFKDGVELWMIPNKDWIIDIGNAKRPAVDNTVISSCHNYGGTPDLDEIMEIFRSMPGDIVKGAFAVDSLKDLAVLYDVSRAVCKRHVIIGMEELGKITRIRSGLLNNEFTFAYIRMETAPGQLSVREMAEIDDNTMVTGIIGSGIGYTRSPAMHDAAFKHSSISGKYLVFDTPSLDRVRDVMIDYNIRGVNITKPYKTDIIEHLDSCDDVSEEIGAVNTVVNDSGELKGYNTDVFGIEKALKANSVDVRGEKVLMIGSGGAARSCAYFLSGKGCDVTVTGRNKEAVRSIASYFGLTARESTSVAVNMYDVVINCTPLNKGNEVSEYPVRIDAIDKSQTVFDMVYGDTHLNEMAKKKGCKVVPGEDMLAFQGIRSFELFTSKIIPYKIMRSAI